jgi:hypothetical protein
MKKTVTVAGLCLTLLSGCIRQSLYSAKSDYNFTELPALKHYRTFAFVVNGCPDYKTPNDALVEKEITHLMRLRGFHLDQASQHAQLVVSYRVYQENIMLKGYDQPMLTHRQFALNAPLDSVYRPLNYHLRKGGMLIQLLDKDRGQTIWRGYISGADYDRFSDERYLKREVRSIFDQFGALANGFLVSK